MHLSTLTPLLCSLALAGAADAPPAEAARGDSGAPASEGLAALAPGLAVVPSALGERGLPLPRPLLAEADGAAADQGDDEKIEEEIEAQSAEMEQMREAEEKARLLPPARPEEDAARSAARLGLESPLRLRLGEALSHDTAPGPEEDPGRIALLPEIGHDLRRLQAEYDIPLEVNEAVLAYVRFFQSEPARSHFVRWLSRSHRYLDRFKAIMREHGLPEDTVFLAMIESGFANLAYSRARACGPWQFIAATGKRMGLKQDFWVDERRDPEKSAHAAARYLKELHDETGDWRLAWAGYNAGAGKIRRARARGLTDFWSMTRGRLLKKETKGYVPKLMAAAIISKHQEAFGFRPEEIEPQRWTEYELVAIPEATGLAAIAGAAEVSEKEILDLNPELRRSCTPPRGYSLKIPRGRGEVFARNWPAAAAAARLSFARHQVQRRDSMAAIAAAYGVPASAVAGMNGLKPGRRLRPGTELVIPLSGLSRRSGRAPASEVAVRARIEEYQKKNPSAVEREPLPKPVAARVDEVDGKARATVLVQAGDSLWAIAQKFGVAVADVCRWNGILNPRRHKLQVGRELVVYPRSAADHEPAASPAASGPG
jgi:membrane-bound lytic murein transglycosylase D